MGLIHLELRVREFTNCAAVVLVDTFDAGVDDGEVGGEDCFEVFEEFSERVRDNAISSLHLIIHSTISKLLPG